MTELTAERLDELKRLAKDGKLNLFFVNTEDRGDMTVDDLVALIEAARASLWRDDMENAPKDGTQILGWSQYLQSVATFAWDEREKDFVPMFEGSRVIEYQSDFGTDYKGGGDVLSHFMALPEPPTPPSEGES